MYRRRFERLVMRAVRQLPAEIRDKMDNVAVVVEDEPTAGQLAASGLPSGDTLLGLYQGVPLTERTSGYGFVLPDKITIFQRPIEDVAASDQAIIFQVRKTVIHEIAHHFGIGDAELRRMWR